MLIGVICMKENEIDYLIKAQRECEELYMEAAQPEVEETMDKLEKMSG